MLDKSHIITYIARDIERALGQQPNESYRIITNRSILAEEIQRLLPEFVTIIDSTDHKILDTHELLQDPKVISILNTSKSSVLVFKNTKLIEDICKQNNWQLLNPSYSLAEQIENKISQITWLDEIGETWLPPHLITDTKNIKWQDKKIVLQWAHGHTGDGTVIVDNSKTLKDIQTKFPNRTVRVTDYINGPSFTVNIVVNKDTICIGNISYQITGLTPFTDTIFSTIGNDWSLTHSILNEQEIITIQKLAILIGQKMQKSGWKGLFGIDIMKDEELNKIFLIEINARQPASTTYESQLQNINRDQGIQGINIFEAHIKALNDETIDSEIIPINDGAQIIQRITNQTNQISTKDIESIITQLADSDLSIIRYNNTAMNSDMLRIQSLMGIMENHNKFNLRGKNIKDIIEQK
jgi:predicted ATP-grasp superfamily ATP-dependent carboligase